jgi:glycosyltransferase involved in cell wall biosynthesis
MKFIKKKPQKNNSRNEQPILVPNQIKVTTITPSYNRFDPLLIMIRSIREQTHKNFEIIVINDGSEDPRYDQLPDMGVKHIKIEHTGLHMVAMNYGLKQASGKYIALLDDDDIWMPEKIEKQLRAMNNLKCQMSSTNARVGSDFWSYEEDKSDHEYFREKLPEIFTLEILKRSNYCMNSSVIFEKSLLEKSGLFKEDPLFRHCADYDLWLRMLKYTNCTYLKESLIYYRDNRTSSSMRYGHGGRSCDQLQEDIKVFEEKTGQSFKDMIGKPINS